MNVIQCGATFETRDLRRRIFAGDIVIVGPTRHSLKLAAFARDLLWEEFTPLNPVDAHRSITSADCAAVLSKSKSRLAAHPEARRLVSAVLADLKCDPTNTFVTAPRLQTMTNCEYLADGPAEPARPHRDTWFAAPGMQVNWWMPVFEMFAENGIAFYPEKWSESVQNNSAQYNHDEFLAGHGPRPGTQVSLDESKSFRPVLQPGGIVLFSAAHLHATVPNDSVRTRYSIDFRTVDLDDVGAFDGADNFDAESTGTTLREFFSAEGSSPLPGHLVTPYDTGAPVVAPA